MSGIGWGPGHPGVLAAVIFVPGDWLADHRSELVAFVAGVVLSALVFWTR